ncbi:MAG: aminofutalosine synthase MqnE [Bacteroidales bacterium]|nr:aminofutalosine synthase MqnE [Bacteroidales bacterium]
MNSSEIETLLFSPSTHNTLQNIAKKIIDFQRISTDDCNILYQEADISFLGVLANYICTHKHNNHVYFNKNIHIEPTNICIHDCVFCSYARKKGESQTWEMTIQQMCDKILSIPEDAITEVHIVGGVHPDRGLDFYCDLLQAIKKIRPTLHIKAFTAIEIEYMAIKSKLSLQETLTQLQAAGLDSMPGGGAEIFDEDLRAQICPSKTKSAEWLKIHEIAHSIDIKTNATILYGHLESYEHRIDHMNRLRKLQDKTSGFQAFIPLKYKKENNILHVNVEVSWIEDLRNFAIARIFLDNIPHIKAYWPMLGKDLAQLSLEFGVNDFDGTINDSTKIYSMAGAEDTNPSMTQEQMVQLIRDARKIPVERDSIYTKMHVFH